MKSLITISLLFISMSLYAQQNLGLSGVSNARQLGGYQIGRQQVKPDVLLRTANLSTATDEDVIRLEETYKVAYVFDFRSSHERNLSPDKELRDCENVWLPCLDKQVKGIDQSKSASSQKVDPQALGKKILENLSHPAMKQMADSLYLMIVFDPEVQKHYATFLQQLSTLPEGRSALWHCTQGKDRAGCASAFLLAALGADRKLIIEDFNRSNESYQNLIDKLVSAAMMQGRTDDEINIIYALVGVSVPLFEKMLDQIDERYGSLDNYLTTALNCDQDLRNKLRERFLH